MAVTYNDRDNLSYPSSLTFTLNAGVEFLVMPAWATKSTTGAMTLTSATITDGVNTLTMTIDGQSSNTAAWASGSNLTHALALCSGKVSAATPSALSAGTCTLALTWSAATTGNNSGATVYQVDTGASSGSLFKAVEFVGSTSAIDPHTAFANMDVQNGGFGLIYVYNEAPWTYSAISGWTAGPAGAAAVSYGAQGWYQNFGADATIAPQPNPAGTAPIRFVSLLAWYKEVNDGDIDTASTSPFEPGETVTFAGTALDVTDVGARIRKVGGSNAYDALTGFADSSAIAATAAIPNRPTRTPYTSEDGTTHTVEFVATTSGVVTGTPTAALTTNAFVPPAGYSRVTIVTPDVTDASLCSAFGWTPAAGDQIEWDAEVDVDGVTVTVTVSDAGLVLLDSSPEDMPSTVTGKFRAYDSVAEQWSATQSDMSDWHSWTFGDDSFLFRRHRYLAFQRLGRFNP